jgi:hypothetical protein
VLHSSEKQFLLSWRLVTNVCVYHLLYPSINIHNEAKSNHAKLFLVEEAEIPQSGEGPKVFAGRAG